MIKKEDYSNGNIYITYDGDGKIIKEVIKDLEYNMNKEDKVEIIELSLVYNKLTNELAAVIVGE